MAGQLEGWRAGGLEGSRAREMQDWRAGGLEGCSAAKKVNQQSCGKVEKGRNYVRPQEQLHPLP